MIQREGYLLSLGTMGEEGTGEDGWEENGLLKEKAQGRKQKGKWRWRVDWGQWAGNTEYEREMHVKNPHRRMAQRESQTEQSNEKSSLSPPFVMLMCPCARLLGMSPMTDIRRWSSTMLDDKCVKLYQCGLSRHFLDKLKVRKKHDTAISNEKKKEWWWRSTNTRRVMCHKPRRIK